MYPSLLYLSQSAFAAFFASSVRKIASRAPPKTSATGCCTIFDRGGSSERRSCRTTDPRCWSDRPPPRYHEALGLDWMTRRVGLVPHPTQKTRALYSSNRSRDSFSRLHRFRFHLLRLRAVWRSLLVHRTVTIVRFRNLRRHLRSHHDLCRHQRFSALAVAHNSTIYTRRPPPRCYFALTTYDDDERLRNTSANFSLDFIRMWSRSLSFRTTRLSPRFSVEFTPVTSGTFDDKHVHVTFL